MRRTFAALSLLLLAGSLPAHARTAGEEFAPCPDASTDARLAGSLCAQFQIPGEKSFLSLRQFPAPSPSHGQVWVVAGESGAELYGQIGTFRQSFPFHDLILTDRRPQPQLAAKDLQAEIDRYAKGGATLLYGASQGGEVVLKALPLVKQRRVEAVILVNPVAPLEPSAPLSATAPSVFSGEVTEKGIELTPPRTLVLQTGDQFTPPADLDRKSPLSVYKIEGLPGYMTVTVPQCAAPLVRDFVENAAEGGAPCAAKLTIRF